MIECEGLHLLCLSCGRFRHYKEGCQERRVANDDNNGGDGSEDRQINGSIEFGETSARPWSTVQKQRKGRKMTVDWRNQRLVSINDGHILKVSRFPSLSDEILEFNDRNNDDKMVVAEKMGQSCKVITKN